MSKEMLINTVEGQESRIAIVNDGVLEELYIERTSNASRVGNIYKGRITNVEPAIQAAFVDFGLSKNGFLHISDVNQQYFPKAQQSAEPVGRKRSHRERPPIQTCLRRGQEVVVQLIKEGIGTKGPTLTTYLSIPGRLLVMMPGMSRLGVSRKIEDDQARLKARQILGELKLPADMGFIVRTAGLDKGKRDLNRDLNYLLRLWKSVEQRIKSSKAPEEIYQESDLVIRTIRDVCNADIDRIICDDEQVLRNVKEFLDAALPRAKNMLELYVGKEGLFHDYGLESEIEKIYSRRVELPSGGSLVIDQTEALVAIDINSGRCRQHTNAEATALKINTEAAKEIARQLRLRDLGGMIVIDFIDMREEANRRAVEKAFREPIGHDRAKTKILKMSRFGIVEMTRQRVRPSLKDSTYRTCKKCDGNGVIKSEESQALGVIRCLERAMVHEDIASIEVAVTAEVSHHLANYRRQQISKLESDFGKAIIIRADGDLAGDAIRVTCKNSRGGVVSCEHTPPGGPGKGEIQTVGIEQLPATPPAAKEPSERDRDEAEQEKKAVGGEAEETKDEQAKAPSAAKKSRRRGRRRRKGSKTTEQKPEGGESAPDEVTVQAPSGDAPPKESTAGSSKSRSRRRRRKKASAAAANTAVTDPVVELPHPLPESSGNG